MFKVVKKHTYHAITIGGSLPIITSLNLTENGRAFLTRKFAETYSEEQRSQVPPLSTASWEIVVTTVFGFTTYIEFIPKH